MRKDASRPRLKLPSRGYIYSVMMARSHEITHHKGDRCTCETTPGPSQAELREAFDLLEEYWRDPICCKFDDWRERVSRLYDEAHGRDR